jgi:hypothetical protein
MYRAGSTWQYNLVSHLVEMFGLGRRIGFCNDGKSLAAGAEALCSSRDELLVLKTHDQHPEFADALAEGRALGVYIYRDLRDVAYSLAHKCLSTFEDIVFEARFLDRAIQNDEFWRSQPRVICQRYEEVIDDPVPAILEIAKHLGLSVSSELAESLAREYSFSANLARTKAVAEQCQSRGLDLRDARNALRHDDNTLLHWNHMREGRPGGWQDEATPEQIVALLAACGDWLIRRGYESDFRWAAGHQDWDGAETAIRGLSQAREHDGKQILTLRREFAELNAESHRLRARIAELETLTPFMRKQALRVQAALERHPRLRTLLKPLFRREGLASPTPGENGGSPSRRPPNRAALPAGR